MDGGTEGLQLMMGLWMYCAVAVYNRTVFDGI